jgi:hypothetical protein
MAHAEGVDGAPSPEGAGAGSWLRNTMLSESRAKVEDYTHVCIWSTPVERWYRHVINWLK